MTPKGLKSADKVDWILIYMSPEFLIRSSISHTVYKILVYVHTYFQYFTQFYSFLKFGQFSTMFQASAELRMQVALAFAQLFLTIDAVSFPPPAGSYGISLTKAELIDHQRLDPYAPTPQPRSLMISLLYPVSPTACSPYLAPYMDPITAAFEDIEYAQDGVPAGAFESLNLQGCQSLRPVELSIHPLVLFSPGMGDTRLFYSAMAQQCVFLVITTFNYSSIPLKYPKSDKTCSQNYS